MKADLSFEVFPPKVNDGTEKIYSCLGALSSFSPSFISVTYSAGNAVGGKTSLVCGEIKNTYKTQAVSHLTCAGATKEKIKRELGELKRQNVDTILALRGDITPQKPIGTYRHATDLMEEIIRCGEFELFGACYPEGHAESGSIYDDLFSLKLKYDLGVRTFISQLFFDDDAFLRMADKASAFCKGATFRAGIMPATSAKSVRRMVAMSNATLPKKFVEILDKYGADPLEMKKAGVDYAIGQIRNLYDEGCENFHLYTMCMTDVTKEIYSGISDLLR